MLFLFFFHRWQCKTCINLGGHCCGFYIFTFINGLRRFTPLILLKNITELLCLCRIIKEQKNIKGDSYWTVSITRTFDTHNVEKWWPPLVGDRGITQFPSARWVLLSMKPKISYSQPKIPGFDLRIFGNERKRASSELQSASVLRAVKMQP